MNANDLSRKIAPGVVLFLTMPLLHAAPPPGQLLASQCAQCHGTDGYGPGFDNLAGKTDLYEELIEMKYEASVEDIMERQARGYTDEQLELIADYFASLPGGPDDDDHQPCDDDGEEDCD